MTEILHNIANHLPSLQELATAVPVIVSLILIEGLLSVDNAMAIAAMASHLPKHQQKKALRWGIVGAYAFRGLCLFFVAWIAANMWIKALGALYLIWLMCKHIGRDEDVEDVNRDHIPDAMQRSLFATIVSIEIMDLSLSLDNVVAAVALDKRLWVVCLGVFIGILALRFVAGYCIKLIERFPVLQHTAFMLVGFVGVILCVELALEHYGIHVHIDSVQKFIGIVIITAGSLWYGESQMLQSRFGGVVRAGKKAMWLADRGLYYGTYPLHFTVGAFLRFLGKPFRPKTGDGTSPSPVG